MLKISDLEVSVEDKKVLKGLTLETLPGEIHVIMGPNGAGKSTLAKVLAGHSAYEVIGGEVLFGGEDLLELDPADRARKGVFIGFQYPVEVPGVTNREFLAASLNAIREARGEEPLRGEAFDRVLADRMNEMGVSEEFASRNLNEGFSGGEKKRNEILQLMLLDPKLAVLDETDSGLDIDAMRVVSDGVNRWMGPEKSLVLITHYHRLLQYIKPDHIHVVIDGKIVMSGGPDLALKLEEKGYDWLEARAC
jgi:Fe-S cluster assembly ATP-binding protein